MAVQEEDIFNVLRQVRIPERDTDIVTEGIVKTLSLDKDHVYITLILEREQRSLAQELRLLVEEKVRGITGVKNVTLVFTPSQKRTPSQLLKTAPPPNTTTYPQPHKIPNPPTKKDLKHGLGFIIAVASGKGGVGKSTTAVNLSLGLASLGLRIGLLDADIYGPSIPRLLSLSEKPTSDEKGALQPLQRYGIQTMSMGLLVEEDTPMIWRGPLIQNALQQFFRDVNWGQLDAFVIDLPPGTGDTQLTLVQKVPLSGAIIVSTPQDLALIDARKGLNMFKRVEVPLLGIIENMSYFLCSSCGTRHHIFGHGGAQLQAESLDVEFLGEIPLDTVIRTTSDEGIPLVIRDPESVHAQTYCRIAARVWEKLHQIQRPLPKIVKM